MKNFSKTKFFVALLSALIVCFQFSSQNVLARDSGGGELAEWDAGDWATSQAIGLGVGALTSGIQAGIDSAAAGAAGYAGQSFSTGFSNSVSSWSSLGTWGNSFAWNNALSQVGTATARAGNYYGWDPEVTNFASSVVTSAVAGGFSGGSGSVVDNVALGAMEGAIKGGVIAAGTNDDGSVETWAPIVGSYVGNIGGNFIKAGFTEVTTTEPTGYNYVTTVQTSKPSYEDYVNSGNYVYGPVSEQGYYDAVAAQGQGGTQVSSLQTTVVPTGQTQQANFSFSNKFNAGQAFQAAANTAIAPFSSPTNIALTATDVGTSYIAANQDGPAARATVNAIGTAAKVGLGAASYYDAQLESYKEQYKRDAVMQHGVVINADDMNYLSSGDPKVASTYISAVSDATGLNSNISANVLGYTLGQENAQYPRNAQIIYNPQVVADKAEMEGVYLDVDYGKISQETYLKTRSFTDLPVVNNTSNKR